MIVLWLIVIVWIVVLVVAPLLLAIAAFIWGFVGEAIRRFRLWRRGRKNLKEMPDFTP